MSKRRKPFPSPPAVGTELVLSKQLSRPTCFDTSDGRRWVSPGARTRVRVTKHTPGYLHWYGPGCYVTPADEEHKWYGREFYVSGDELCYLQSE